MERKLGEIFEFDGEWYQCVEQPEKYDNTVCELCDFHGIGNCELDRCSGDYRSDKKGVIFKKIEKVGEPMKFARGLYVQKYHLADSTAFYKGDTRLFFDAPTKTFVYIEIKQNKEDMEEKNNGNTPLNVLTDKYVNGDICYDDFEKEVKALYSCKEESKPTLKPFDLEAAKAGKAVCTRDGRKARIICFNQKGAHQPIVALITEDDEVEFIETYHLNGRFNDDDKTESGGDLMMLPEKKEGWVNVYKNQIHNTFESAEEGHKGTTDYIKTIKVEWEE